MGTARVESNWSSGAQQAEARASTPGRFLGEVSGLASVSTRPAGYPHLRGATGGT
jgi:hypothetical protein